MFAPNVALLLVMFVTVGKFTLAPEFALMLMLSIPIACPLVEPPSPVNVHLI